MAQIFDPNNHSLDYSTSGIFQSNMENHNTIIENLETESLEVTGDLKVGGTLEVNKLNLQADSLILSYDMKYIESILNEMDVEDLNHFIKHIMKLRAIAEKKIIDQA